MAPDMSVWKNRCFLIEFVSGVLWEKVHIHTTKPTSGGNRLFRTLLPRVCVVPDLIGDLLLVLLLLAGTAAAKDDESEENEKHQNTDYYSCDDASCVRGCKGKDRFLLRCTGLEYRTQPIRPFTTLQ